MPGAKKTGAPKNMTARRRDFVRAMHRIVASAQPVRLSRSLPKKERWLSQRIMLGGRPDGFNSVAPLAT
jgi:hypothetical protein